MRLLTTLFILFILGTAGCKPEEKLAVIVTGAERTDQYLPQLEGKSIALVANQTSVIGGTHLVDTLLSMGVNIKLIFAPEHGFRDLADDGATISNGTDPETGIPVVSLYTGKRKPSHDDLAGIDYVVYDIQDVGTRFYTYLTTMCYVMEACAEESVPFMIFDRPNPNGFYIDGPVLDTAYRSFVGIHQVPVVHGMTLGEYATMVNGESWLAGGIKCDLHVVLCRNYTHSSLYRLPVRPSPNLPDMNAVYLYPSLCFSEGTVLSCGRGTDFAFQVLGAPEMPDTGFAFTPTPGPGASNPKYNGQVCYGTDLRDALKDGLVPRPGINLQWIIDCYKVYPEKEKFFNNYFNTLAGTSVLREQIEQGMNADEIRATWKEGLNNFAMIREKYLLYDL